VRLSSGYSRSKDKADDTRGGRIHQLFPKRVKKAGPPWDEIRTEHKHTKKDAYDKARPDSVAKAQLWSAFGLLATA
jgi:hypothetical protein